MTVTGGATIGSRVLSLLTAGTMPRRLVAPWQATASQRRSLGAKDSGQRVATNLKAGLSATVTGRPLSRCRVRRSP